MYENRDGEQAALRVPVWSVKGGQSFATDLTASSRDRGFENTRASLAERVPSGCPPPYGSHVLVSRHAV